MSDPLLELVDLTLAYPTRTVLSGVCLTVRRGEVLSLVGPSGAGKTTLLKSMNLLLQPANGELRYSGAVVFRARRRTKVQRPLHRLIRGMGDDIERETLVPVHQHRAHFGMVFQEFNLWPTYTLRENIAAPLLWHEQMQRNAIMHRVDECAALVRIDDVLDRYPSDVSGGQRQRAAIARALVSRPEVLLLDEITSALDPELVRGILELVEQLAGAGFTLVVVTHHMPFAQRLSTRVAFVANGAVSEPRESKDFFGAKDGAVADFLSHFIESSTVSTG